MVDSKGILNADRIDVKGDKNKWGICKKTNKGGRSGDIKVTMRDSDVCIAISTSWSRHHKARMGGRYGGRFFSGGFKGRFRCSCYTYNRRYVCARSSCGRYESRRTGVGGKKDEHRIVGRSGTRENIQGRISFYSGNSIVYYGTCGDME